MPERTPKQTAAELDAAARQAKTDRIKSAQAARSRVVPHPNRLTPPVTLSRYEGGRSNKDKMFLENFKKTPTVRMIQEHFGGGYYILEDVKGFRYQVNLAALPDPELAEDPQPEAPPPHEYRAPDPRPGPRFDPYTGASLAPPPRAPAMYDAYTGQPIHAQPHYPAPYHRPIAPPAAAAPTDDLLRTLVAELRARNAAPLPPANDMGGQIKALLEVSALLETVKERFSPNPVEKDDDDEDGSAGILAMVDKVMTMLRPQVAPVQAVAGPPQAAAPLRAVPDGQAAPQAEEEEDEEWWAEEPLNAEEMQGAEAMLAQFRTVAPGLTVEALIAIGDEADATPRQTVYIFQQVLTLLNGGELATEEEDEEWSEEEADPSGPTNSDSAAQPAPATSEPPPPPPKPPETTPPETSPATP